MIKYTEAAFRALEHDMIAFASDHHRHQTYGGDKPYTFHLRAVRDVVYRFMPYLPFGLSIEVLILGAWGHDLMEDCGVTLEELSERYGQEVAEIIYFVSDEPGKNRKEHAGDDAEHNSEHIHRREELHPRKGGTTGVYHSRVPCPRPHA